MKLAAGRWGAGRYPVSTSYRIQVPERIHAAMYDFILAQVPLDSIKGPGISCALEPLRGSLKALRLPRQDPDLHLADTA